jgi:hypothetical protein
LESKKFNMLLENYYEHEAHLLNLVLRDSIFSERDYVALQDAVHAVNRRVVNLLSSARLYSDHVAHDLSGLYGSGSEQIRHFRSRQSSEYDSHLAYRTMEAVRNYLQHRSFPIHGLSLVWTIESVGQPGSIVHHTARPSISAAELRKDGEFKAAVLAELEATGPKIEVSRMIRQYMSCLSRIHAGVRAALASDLETAEATIRKALETGAAELGDTVGLAAVRVVECSDGQEEYDAEDVFDDSLKRHAFLVSRTARASDFERMYVSNRANDREA